MAPMVEDLVPKGGRILAVTQGQAGKPFWLLQPGLRFRVQRQRNIRGPKGCVDMRFPRFGSESQKGGF